jgi:hypothetical protein
MQKNTDYIRLSLVVVFIIATYLLYDKIYQYELPEFGVNIVASFICTIVTIALMSLLMKYQMASENDRESRKMLFETKLAIYREFLVVVFAVDDDNIIDKNEVQAIENKVGEIALVASSELVELCVRFVVQLKCYGVLYHRSMVTKQKEHYEQNIGSLENFVTLDDLVQGIRKDLSVVDGDVSKLLERVVSVKYDAYQMIKDPNVID